MRNKNCYSLLLLSFDVGNIAKFIHRKFIQSLKLCSYQEKAKILFDVCHLFFDHFRLFLIFFAMTEFLKLQQKFASSTFQQEGQKFPCLSAMVGMAAPRKKSNRMRATVDSSTSHVTLGKKRSKTSGSAPGFFSSVGASRPSSVSYCHTKCTDQ